MNKDIRNKRVWQKKAILLEKACVIGGEGIRLVDGFSLPTQYYNEGVRK